MRLEALLDEELALLAVHGDSEAFGLLWERTIPTARRLGKFFHRRYPWIEAAEISQGVLIDFPKILNRYDPEKGVLWAKYSYISYYRACQDFLRKHDPIGIKFPQRKHYPGWCSLDAIHGGRNTDQVIIDGLKRLDQ